MTTIAQPTPTLARAPGPVGPLDRVRNIPAFSGDLLGFMQRLARDYGDFAQFGFGPVTMYLVNHPDLIHQVLVEDAAKYYKTKLTKELLRPSLGDGTLISDGEHWRRQRKLMQPAFHAKRIEGYAATMSDYAERALASWQVGQTRDVVQDMMELTLDIVIKTLFGEELTPEERRDIGLAVTYGQEDVGRAFRSVIRAPRWLPTERNRRAEWALNAINAIIARFVARYRQTGEDRGDLLAMILSEVDERGGMNDADARDEAFTLIVAGHETTANTLSWAFYSLSQNPQAEAALREELARVLGGRAPTFHDLPNLPYTNAVIKETLRLYPAAYVVSREAQEDARVGNYVAKKGYPMLISPFVTHRDARWFDEPLAFKPERWLGDLESRLPRFAYFPFGGGPRVCIGNQFSLMESRLILASIAQKFRLALAPGCVVEMEPLVTLRMKHGLKMVVTG